MIRSEFYAATTEGAALLSSWVSTGIPGCERGWDNCVGMGVFDGKSLIAGVIFHDYNPEAGTMCMSAHATNRRWLTRPTLFWMHDYVFNVAGCQLAIMQVSERNSVMNSIAQRFGYQPTRIPRLRGREEAEIIWTLADDDWRESKFYLRCQNGQTKTANPA